MENRGLADKTAVFVTAVAGLITATKRGAGRFQVDSEGARGFDPSLGTRLRLPVRWSTRASKATVTVTMCN
jgi:hypothetical protein